MAMESVGKDIAVDKTFLQSTAAPAKPEVSSSTFSGRVYSNLESIKEKFSNIGDIFKGAVDAIKEAFTSKKETVAEKITENPAYNKGIDSAGKDALKLPETSTAPKEPIGLNRSFQNNDLYIEQSRAQAHLNPSLDPKEHYSIMPSIKKQETPARQSEYESLNPDQKGEKVPRKETKAPSSEYSTMPGLKRPDTPSRKSEYETLNPGETVVPRKETKAHSNEYSTMPGLKRPDAPSRQSEYETLNPDQKGETVVPRKETKAHSNEYSTMPGLKRPDAPSRQSEYETLNPDQKGETVVPRKETKAHSNEYSTMPGLKRPDAPSRKSEYEKLPDQKSDYSTFDKSEAQPRNEAYSQLEKNDYATFDKSDAQPRNETYSQLEKQPTSSEYARANPGEGPRRSEYDKANVGQAAPGSSEYVKANVGQPPEVETPRTIRSRAYSDPAILRQPPKPESRERAYTDSAILKQSIQSVSNFASKAMKTLFGKKSIEVEGNVKFTFVKKLGQGNYKSAIQVDKVKNVINELGNEIQKVKTRVLLVADADAQSQKTDEDFQNEIAVNSQLRQISNDAKVKGQKQFENVAIAKPISYQGETVFSTRLMTGGTVLKNIANSDPETRNGMVRDMINGVRELHSVGIKHRDIKADNFLVDANGRVKIADMGKAYSGDKASRTLIALVFSPPETLYDPTNWSEKADVYQLGVTLFQTLAGIPTFMELRRAMAPNLSEEAIRSPVQTVIARDQTSASNWKGMEKLNPEVRSFLSKMLDPDPNNRPNMEQVAQFFGA